MHSYSDVNSALAKAVKIKDKSLLNETIDVKGLSFIRLRDILNRIGKIHQEYLSEKIYIASIKGGWLGRNYATIAVQLTDNSIMIAAYADEGIINQRTSEGALNEFKKSIREYTK